MNTAIKNDFLLCDRNEILRKQISKYGIHDYYEFAKNTDDTRPKEKPTK